MAAHSYVTATGVRERIGHIMEHSMNRKQTKPRSPRRSTVINSTDEESLLRRNVHSEPTGNFSARLARGLIFKTCLASARGEGFIGLMQDIVCGIVLGTVGMSLLLLLDYFNVVNLESARVFRKTASHVLNSNELFLDMEKEIDKRLELVPVADYNAMIKELSDSKAVIENQGKVFSARLRKEAALKDELNLLRVEYDKMMIEAGLDTFCPSCRWGMGMNCQQRLNYMLETYSDSATTIECIKKLVDDGKTKNGKCLRPQ
ncbi:hypothetical protein ACHAWF_011526 [Thalassiosira exigua]